MRCPICKQEIKDYSKFCSKCGSAIPQKKKKRWISVLLGMLVLVAISVVIIILLCFSNEKFESLEKKKIVFDTENITEIEEQERMEQDITVETEERETIEPDIVTELEEIQENNSENILEKMKEVSEITKIIWGYSEYLDEQDVIQANYFGMENWTFKCVAYSNIKSIKDFENLLKDFYTDNVVANLLTILQYVEQDGKLYVAEADGMGWEEVGEYYVRISHETENVYKVEVSQYIDAKYNEIPEVVNYRLTDKGWRFDQSIVFWDDAPLTLCEEEEMSVQEVSGIEKVIDVSENVILNVAATSYLDEKEYNIKHLPEFVIDGDLETAWVEGKTDQGIGETIVFEFREECEISGLVISAGYQKSTSLYQKNSRPAAIRLTFSDGSTKELELNDIKGEHKFTFGYPKIAKSVSVTILDVYSGDTYADTAISEISFF